MCLKLVPSTNLWVATCVLSILPIAAVAATEVPPGGVVPLDDIERRHLSRTARRTVEDVVRGRPPYQPGFVPKTLSSKTATVIVRLRHGGFLLATASSRPASLTTATIAAAGEAAEDWSERFPDPEELLARLLIEIEVVGPSEPIPETVDWTEPRAVDAFVEPGVHGIELIGPKVRQRVPPTEFFTSDMVLADALETIAKKLHLLPADVKQTRLARFRTAHWYQDEPHGRVVSLHRGMTRVPSSAVSREGLDRAIDTLGAYMLYRQLPSGLFSYQYEPAWNRYVEDDNLVRQVGAAVAVAAYADASGRPSARAAADLAVAYHLKGLRDVPGRSDAAYIATADDKNKLGVTALLTLALAEQHQAKRYAESRRKLVRGMLTLQRDSGMFITAFPPARELGAQDYFPGEALLALAAHYRHEPSAVVLDAFDRAIEFYRDYFRARPSPAFVSWQVQAYALIAQRTKRREYVDYVFELADWLAARQLNESNCAWPELWGGIASYQPNRAGVSTAAYLEGFADALELAREVTDAPRARRYERVVREAARFVLQLQFREEEAYFVRSTRDAVGGIRTAPALNLLRIDHCQHALIALMKSRRVLFGHEP